MQRSQPTVFQLYCSNKALVFGVKALNSIRSLRRNLIFNIDCDKNWRHFFESSDCLYCNAGNKLKKFSWQPSCVKNKVFDWNLHWRYETFGYVQWWFWVLRHQKTIFRNFSCKLSDARIKVNGSSVDSFSTSVKRLIETLTEQVKIIVLEMESF